MKKNKPEVCGNELSLPQLAPVSCPQCGLILGSGAFLNTDDPCFDPSWKAGNFVVIEGIRIDRTSTLAPVTYRGSKCKDCPVNRREVRDVWPEEAERRKDVKK